MRYSTTFLCCSPRHMSAAPARRLWSFLVRQEAVQEIFIRCVFGKKRSLSTLLDVGHHVNDGSPALRGGANSSEEHKGATTVDSSGNPLPEPVRIIHKEQDSISAFCLNQVRLALMDLNLHKFGPQL